MAFPDSPFGYQDELEELLSQSEDRINGLTSDREKLQGQYDAITQSTQSEGLGAYGSVVIPFLAGYFGGGGGGPGTTAGLVAAGKAGETYYNNLDSDEKARKAYNLAEQKRITDERQDQINFSQQLTGYGVQSLANKEQSYLTGSYPGTAPYETKQDDILDIYSGKQGSRVSAQQQIDQNKANIKGTGRMISPDDANAMLADAGSTRRVTEPILASELNVAIGAVRAGAQKQSSDTGVASLQQRERKMGMERAGRAVFGTVDIPGMTAPTEAVNKFREVTSGVQKATVAIGGLKDSLAKNGIGITGLPAAEQAALSYNLWSAMRIAQETGANLTGSEPGALSSFTPATMAGPDGGPAIVLSILKGRSDPEFLDTIQSILMKTYAAQALSVNKFVPDEALYDTGTLDKLKAQGASFDGLPKYSDLRGPQGPSAPGASMDKRARLKQLLQNNPALIQGLR